MAINNLLDKELKVMVIKIVTELKKKMDEFSKNCNKETESIKKNQS